MKPPQHHRKRGYRKTLASVLCHVEAGRCGYDDALWLFYHVAGLRSRLDRAEGELKGMRENVDALQLDRDFWCKAAWECDAAREQSVEVEPLPRLELKGYHDVEEFYPPNEEADDA